MTSTDVYESLIIEVAALDRAALIDRLARFPGKLRLDFSDEFLNHCDDDRLRHMLLAALWRCRMKSNVA